jgi:predicted ATPase
LAVPTCRLLTLVGSGGIGKTRLAIQAAAQLANFAQGVYFVPLAPVGSPDLLASAIAGALQVSFYGSDDPTVQLVNYLREKHLLLLLDNFEHLREGTPLLTDILDAAPALKMLVTSRERLNLQEEWVLPVEGMQYPKGDEPGSIEDYSAVRLFVQSARRVQPAFTLADDVSAVIAICQHVEGMPLGLELAAVWLRVMSCRQIAVQLERSLDFLTTPLRNVPERHRSLRVVFEQSWRLLSESERRVLATLAVFHGGFDLEAAEQVAGASLSLLAGLVDKSLIRLNRSGRYDLHELFRQFASDKLAESGETAAATRRHFEYYAELAERAERHLYGPEQEGWFDRLAVDLDNLRAALAWSVRDEEAETGLRLAGSLGWFWGTAHSLP